MNLDDLSRIKQIDVLDMRSHIEGLPDQFLSAWELGSQLPLPTWEGIERVLVAGMGGSAIGADLAAAYVAPHSRVPIVIHRNYNLPAWAEGEKTLVVVSSHSGNTEETLSSFKSAIENQCRILILTTGGKLAQLSQDSDSVLWQFQHEGQPRTAVGYSAGLLLAALSRFELIPNPEADIKATIQAMRSQQATLEVEVPTVYNPAKRMAGQIYGRWVTIIGADILEPVARRWKTQISEIAKAWGQFENIPEVDHNTLAGVHYPEQVLSRTMAIFLRASSCHPRNQLRIDLTKSTFMLEGINTDFIDAQGPNALAHQWTALHFGDYTSFYLAIAYGVDPTAIPAIEMLKGEMASSS